MACATLTREGSGGSRLHRLGPDFQILRKHRLCFGQKNLNESETGISTSKAARKQVPRTYVSTYLKTGIYHLGDRCARGIIAKFCQPIFVGIFVDQIRTYDLPGT